MIIFSVQELFIRQNWLERLILKKERKKKLLIYWFPETFNPFLFWARILIPPRDMYNKNMLIVKWEKDNYRVLFNVVFGSLIVVHDP